MNRNASESPVDRLIALAQQKPARPGAGASDEPDRAGRPVALGPAVGRESWSTILCGSACCSFGRSCRISRAAEDEQPDAAVDGAVDRSTERDAAERGSAGGFATGSSAGGAGPDGRDETDRRVGDADPRRRQSGTPRK